MSTIRKTVRAARALLRKGRLVEARAKFDQALTLNPDHAEALHGLGLVALASQSGDEAVHWCERALAVTPKAADVLSSMGQALMLLGRSAEAIGVLETAASRRPKDESIRDHLKQARRLAQSSGGRPGSAGASNLVQRGRDLLARGRIELAVAAFERAVEQAPDDWERHWALGNGWMQDGRLQWAERAHREALRLHPTSPIGHLSLGEVLAAAGRRAEAEGVYREAIQLEPNFGHGWLRLVQLRRYQAQDDPDLRALQRLVETQGVGAADVEAAHFALGKIYDDLGQPDASFRHLRQANEQHKIRQPFELRQLLDLMEHIEKVCDPQLLARFEGWGSESQVPVFIVGVPRCGSTLVEQIIASHPDAYGVGELRRLARLTGDLPARLGSTVPFPGGLKQLEQKVVHSLAEDYLRRLTRDAGDDALRICDKMLSNVLLIGLIAAIFPRARVIHCHRHLMDVGLSIYAHSFSGSGVGYAYDLDEIGRYHRQCSKLMTHWKRHAPLTIIDVHYEALVSNPESEIRTLLDRMGLSWAPQCLEFHKADRQVRTASEWQVREPIHTRSVERWRAYETHLEPLRKYLS